MLGALAVGPHLLENAYRLDGSSSSGPNNNYNYDLNRARANYINSGPMAGNPHGGLHEYSYNNRETIINLRAKYGENSILEYHDTIFYSDHIRALILKEQVKLWVDLSSDEKDFLILVYRTGLGNPDHFSLGEQPQREPFQGDYIRLWLENRMKCMPYSGINDTTRSFFIRLAIAAYRRRTNLVHGDELFNLYVEIIHFVNHMCWQSKWGLIGRKNNLDIHYNQDYINHTIIETSSTDGVELKLIGESHREFIDKIVLSKSRYGKMFNGDILIDRINPILESSLRDKNDVLRPYHLNAFQEYQNLLYWGQRFNQVIKESAENAIKAGVDVTKKEKPPADKSFDFDGTRAPEQPTRPDAGPYIVKDKVVKPDITLSVTVSPIPIILGILLLIGLMKK